MEYRFQINNDDSWGADYQNKDKQSCEKFLNDYRDYEMLDVKRIVNDLIEIISVSPYLNNYQKKLKDLKSSEIYKILVVGVGCHNADEISLKAKNLVETNELAHIDLVEKNGSWMNRLYLCKGKPDTVTFYNKKVGNRKTENNLSFDEQYATIICNF